MAQIEGITMVLANNEDEGSETEVHPRDVVRDRSMAVDEIEGYRVDADESIVLWTINIFKSRYMDRGRLN
jgi:hypothetical protein